MAKALKMASVGPVMVTILSGQFPSEMLILAPLWKEASPGQGQRHRSTGLGSPQYMVRPLPRAFLQGVESHTLCPRQCPETEAQMRGVQVRGEGGDHGQGLTPGLPLPPAHKRTPPGPAASPLHASFSQFLLSGIKSQTQGEASLRTSPEAGRGNGVAHRGWGHCLALGA